MPFVKKHKLSQSQANADMEMLQARYGFRQYQAMRLVVLHDLYLQGVLK